MSIILLDPVGDATPPDGYRVVDNEVDFLQHAPGDQPLLVRGIHLCDWARNFYAGRQIAVHETQSPLREIQAVIPELSEDLALDLYRQFDRDQFIALDRPLSPLTIVAALHPGRLWQDPPSLSHAAEWLLWLNEKDPSPTLQVVLSAIAQKWRQTAPGLEVRIYRATNKQAARNMLEAWLHITTNPEFTDFGEFPLAVPTELHNLAREEWRKQIVRTDGSFFLGVPVQPIPGSLKSLAAQETYNHLHKHPQKLNHTIYRALEPYLSLAQQAELAKHLPPNPPGPLPDSPAEVLTWFEQHYLPFRRWQSWHGDEVATQQADDAAREFAVWYLDRYPGALMGGPLRDYLSFRQLVEQRRRSDGVVTLVAVLDGLHVDDARQLKHEIETKTTRLTALQDDCAFAPLPTVTSFTKEALLKGVSPGRVGEVGYLGEVLPERKEPSERVEHLVLGDVLIWRVMEPDATYHGRNSYETLRRDVESALANVAQKLADVVERVSPTLPLRIIITTDHGRLLAKSPRTLETPAGMESHGRAAWGPARTSFGKSGYALNDDVAFLHGESFGLPSGVGEVALMIGSAMFKTNDAKGGAEVFPHGGLYPEEVIVPWMVLERDWVMPPVEIVLQGSGTAGRSEAALLRIVNTSDVPLTLQALLISRGGKESDVLRGQTIDSPAQSREERAVEIDPWPTEAELDTLSARATLELATGRMFETSVALSLASQELYQRDNILEDLDL